jgi:hypothetical protein
MKTAARVAACAVALAAAPLFTSAQSTIPVSPEVQHFGPLVVVAFHQDWPDPESYRSDLFTENAEGRRRLLRALGFESSPDLKALWLQFLKEHPEKDEEKILAEFASGGLLPSNLRLSKSEPLDLSLGFEGSSEHPFEIRGFYNLREGHWRHIATLACDCTMSDQTEPFILRPGQTTRPEEYVVSIPRKDDLGDYHRKEIRFRWKDGYLRHLIDFESTWMNCPQGTSYGPACTVVETSLEPTRLRKGDSESFSGFALVSRSGHPTSCDKCVLMLRDPKCVSYVWDESTFSYRPSDLNPAYCGAPPIPPRKPPATLIHTGRPE